MEQITGFFLSFPENDCRLIRERLTTLEYSPDIDGLKEFLLDSLFDEEEEDLATPEQSKKDHLIRMAVDYVQEHPEQVQYYKNMFGQAFTNLMKKTRGK